MEGIRSAGLADTGTIRGSLQVEYPITFGRDTSKRGDILLMDLDRPMVPYIIIEVNHSLASRCAKDFVRRQLRRLLRQ